MPLTQKLTGRGGAGRGQGRKTNRPKGDKRTVRIYEDLQKRMGFVTNFDQFVNDCIEEKLNRLDAIEKAALDFSDID